jgi:hypothetical protein
LAFRHVIIDICLAESKFKVAVQGRAAWNDYEGVPVDERGAAEVQHDPAGGELAARHPSVSRHMPTRRKADAKSGGIRTGGKQLLW